MPAQVEITPWHWAVFIVLILGFLGLDLAVFHRRSRPASLAESIRWTAFWVAVALAFAGILAWTRDRSEATQFLTGYFIELSLSMDNVLVIALVFSYFQVAAEHQHRVLFLGVLGALIMRGIMIWAGVELINRFDWLLYFFGAFLLFTGVRLAIRKTPSGGPEGSRVVRVARKFLPLSPSYDGGNFITRWNGRKCFTPLVLVLLAVETSDVVFAVDSIPAIFGVTRKSFIVFTSNILAIIGLRSLFFVLSGAMGLFHYLRAGLSAVLVFIGVKMLIDPHENPSPKWFQYDVPDVTALIVVVAILAVSILASLFVAGKGPGDGKAPGQPA